MHVFPILVRLIIEERNVILKLRLEKKDGIIMVKVTMFM